MKSILISGFVNTGKTTICALLKERIMANDGVLIFDGKPKAIKETLVILKKDNEYFGISSIGDKTSEIEDGFEKIMNYAQANNIKLNYLFFTSRSRGLNHKTALELGSRNGSECFEFYTNQIQDNIADKQVIKVQKEYFLDYILKVVSIDL